MRVNPPKVNEAALIVSEGGMEKASDSLSEAATARWFAPSETPCLTVRAPSIRRMDAPILPTSHR
jgi:hypothetical protein